MTEQTTELPAWGDLSEADQAAAVFFIRSADLSASFDYAADHYAVKFQGEVSYEQMRRVERRYRGAYYGLSVDDFWHLYSIGEKAR